MSSLAFLSSTELIWVAVLAIVVFGGSQLPKLARNLGRAQKELQKGLADGAAEAERAAEVDSAVEVNSAVEVDSAVEADSAEGSSD